MEGKLKIQGYTKLAVSQELGVDRKTVSKYWNMSEEQYRASGRCFLCREKSFEDYRGEILEIYAANEFEKLPMSSVYDYLEGKRPGRARISTHHVGGSLPCST